MKKIIVLLISLLLFVTQISCSKTSGKDIKDLIPKGMEILERIKGEPVIVEGDLNRDGILDIAAVLGDCEGDGSFGK